MSENIKKIMNVVKIHRPKGFKVSNKLNSLNVQLITWNIATQFPEPDLNLQSLLTNTSPDMILFGLQEVKAQPQNLVTDQLLTGEDPWTLCLRKSLSSLGYMKIRTIRLQGIVLSLYSLSRHVPHIRGLETQYTRIGLGGYWGNKGCVSIRWKMYGVSVCVINSHLDAHHHQNQLRIDNYNYILGSHMFSNKETEMILYHDYVFWMGDLNFRLESEEADLTPDDVVNSISNHDFGKLQALDQLAIARKEAKAFSELNENLPNFAPTYKYKIGSSVYDTKRAPAWTDRILFKCNVANYDNYQLSLHQHSYSCLQDMNQSDHKPVCSNFTISVFSDQIASDLLLPCFNPIINFVTTGPHFVNEDLLVIYTVKIDERRFLNSWDWIGLFRADCTNLEDYVAYTYASTKLVRDGAYEVTFNETDIFSPGKFRLVYFSSGVKDILGVSDVFSVRFREFLRPVDRAVEAKERPSLSVPSSPRLLRPSSAVTNRPRSLNPSRPS